MDKIIILLIGGLACWYLIKKILRQLKSNCEGCCNNSCGLNCFKDDKSDANYKFS